MAVDPRRTGEIGRWRPVPAEPPTAAPAQPPDTVARIDGRSAGFLGGALAVLLVTALVPWATAAETTQVSMFGQTFPVAFRASYFLWGADVSFQGFESADDDRVYWFSDDAEGNQVGLVRAGSGLIAVGALVALVGLVAALATRRPGPVIPALAAGLVGLGAILFHAGVVRDQDGLTVGAAWPFAAAAVGLLIAAALHGARAPALTSKPPPTR